MMNRISNSIPIAAIISLVVYVMAQGSAPSTTPAIESTAGDGIRLWQAIQDAPPEVEAMAETIGFERFAYVPPRLYTLWNPKRFDRATFHANLAQIKAICRGAEWIGTDLEGRPRDIIRHPNDYGRTEVNAAKEQFRTMWAAFHDVFPDARQLEYNWDGSRPLMAELLLQHLDAVSPSVYITTNPESLSVKTRRLNEAICFGAEHDLPVIAWTWGRRKVKAPDDDEVVLYEPLPDDLLAAMLDLATSDGVYGLIFWDNTYPLEARGDPKRVVVETLKPDYERTEVDAWTAVVLGQTRRAAKSHAQAARAHSTPVKRRKGHRAVERHTQSTADELRDR
ncbi:MAG: hypothetical protein V3T53_03750 [Phycisphaerales bacterium]